MSEAGTPIERRKRGRPRLTPGVESGDQREKILHAAAQLFISQGYAGTGTREIAAAAGLEQSSLYNWFSRKDNILAELLDRTIPPALATKDLLNFQNREPDVRLHALTRFTVRSLCDGPVNLAILQLLPEAKGTPFAEFWARREALKFRYWALLAELESADRLVVDNLELATDLVFGLVESVITWFDRLGPLSIGQVAEFIASSVIRAVVSPPLELDRLRMASDEALISISI
jgi:AcrR family transcriptional regulator